MSRLIRFFTHAILTLALLISLASPLQAKAVRDVLDVVSDHWVNLSQSLEADELDQRLILLDFWTYCCVNCIQSLPMIGEIHDDFGDKISVIGIHSGKFGNEKTELPIKRAIERYGIAHGVYNDASFDVWKQYDVQGWPTLILLAPDGEVLWRHFGEAAYEDVANAVRAALVSYDGDIKTDPLPVEAVRKPAMDESAYYFPAKIISLDAQSFALSDSGRGDIVILDPHGQEIKRYHGFSSPQGLAHDTKQNHLYVADAGHHQIKRIKLNTDDIDIVLGRSAQRGGIVGRKAIKAHKAMLASPWDITFYNGDLMIANAGTHQLLKFDMKKKRLSVFAGNGREFIDDGRYPDNSLSQPSALAVMGDYLYFLDAETSALRRADETGHVETLIGKGLFDFGHVDGRADKARMQHPLGLAADAAHNRLFIADSYNHVLRYYDLATGVLRSISGKAGVLGSGQLDTDHIRYHEPNDVLVLPDGGLMIVDTNNHRVLKLDPRGGKISTF
jgi:thiol-disulfide isomerase/thioredoxin